MSILTSFNSIKIKHLADCPELSHLLASWFFDEWGNNNPTLTMETIENLLNQRMNRNTVPLCLVMFVNDQPVATATLKIREMETHLQYEHWLGNVYVLPEFRNQGVGSFIIHKALNEAKRIGIVELYLYTRDQESLYERSGWRIIEQVEYHGRKASIMKKELLTGHC